MDIELSESQLHRAGALLASSYIADHDRRGLKMLLGRHENRKLTDLGRELGISGYAVTKRCRDIAASGVDGLLKRLELEAQLIERARRFLPGDDIASLACEFEIPERQVRHLLDRSQLALPSNRGIQAIEDLFGWADSDSEPVLDLAGISISANGTMAMLALHEPSNTQVHYRGFLQYELHPKAHWTELSAQDQRFGKVFGFLQDISGNRPVSLLGPHSERDLRFIEKIRSRFPLPYIIVVIVDSPSDVDRWKKLTDNEKRIAVHCCDEPLFNWLERYFYTMRVERSSVGLAPNLAALYAALAQSPTPKNFEWLGSATNAEVVIRRRLAVNLFHAAQGHVHELTPWLWSRMRRKNSMHLVTFRWNTKVHALGAAANGRDGTPAECKNASERLVSVSPLPGIAYLLRLGADASSRLAGDLRETCIAQRIYLSNGLDRPGIRPRYVFCDAHELATWQAEAKSQKNKGKKESSEMPGSSAVLLARHLLFPAPPVNLEKLAAIGTQTKIPVDRQIVASVEGPEDVLIFCAPNLLRGIRDAFDSEVYGDLIIEATSWEEQSIFNLCSTGTLGDDVHFLDAMEQVNPRMPILRPGGSASETEERWNDLFYNGDADFLISGISEEKKQAVERQLDEWVGMVTAVIAEIYSAPNNEALDVTKITASAPGDPNPLDYRDCFHNTIRSFANAQRRVARRAVETCARMAIAGLSPVAIAIMPVRDIIREFRRELQSRIRTTRFANQSMPLLEEQTKASSNGSAGEIAELLIAAKRMLTNPKSEKTFWEQMDELALVGFIAWENALDVLYIQPDRSEFERVIIAYVKAVVVKKAVGRAAGTGPKLRNLNTRGRKEVARKLAAYVAALPLLRKALAILLCRHTISLNR